MPTSEAAFVSALVLAAGGSTRLGQPKQLLPLGDRCLLRWVLDAALASRVDEVIVVLGHCADSVRAAVDLGADPRLAWVVNPHHAAGQSTSLRCGLAALDPRACAAAVLLGDQPHVSPERIDAVVAAFLASGARAARPVHPEAGGTPGHPVVLGRALWPELTSLSGDRGARDLFAAHPGWLLSVPVTGPPAVDVDTWDDYRRLCGS